MRLGEFDNPYGGLFSQSSPLRPRPHDPQVALWGATLIPSGGRHLHTPVGGAGWDLRMARDACLGEAIERYQPYAAPDDERVGARFRDWPLAEPAVGPGCWVLFHPDQYAREGFPFVPFTPSTLCHWVSCRSLTDGGRVWVPEDCVFLFPRPEQVHRLCPGISTGLSCGRWGDPVLLRGLQEVIERDALMGAWWGRYPLEEWPWEQVAERLGDTLCQRLERPNLTYRGYLVRTPYSAHVTILTLAGDDQEGFCFSAGAACRETRLASWRKAALEAVQGRYYARYLRRQLGAGGVPETPGDFAEHALYYSLHPRRLRDTVLEGALPPAGDEGEKYLEDLACLQARLGSNRPVLFRLLSPPDLASVAPNWYVLRVLVPGLQPMHGNHALPMLGGPLWAPRALADWERIPPHPFP